MEFTKTEKQVGAKVKYTVIDYDCRELEKSFKEIEAVAKRDHSDLWERFVEWATSKALYKTEYKKQP